MARQPRRPDTSTPIPAVSPEGKIAPHAMETEMAVLGAMMLDSDTVSVVLSTINRDAFYKPAHQLIFDAIVALYEKREPADIITVAEELKRRDALDQTGGDVYLAELTSHVGSFANVEYHAHILLEKAILRGLIRTSMDISARAFSNAEDALDLLDEAERMIFTLSEQKMKKSFISIGDAVFTAVEKYNKMHSERTGVTGVPTDYTDLDNVLGGFQPGNLVIIAGRPGAGKTAFALSVARNVAIKHNVPVGLFSLEMSLEELALRLIAGEARINQKGLHTGRLPDQDWKKLSTSLGKLYKAKIYIDDTPGLGILELRAKARRLRADSNTKVGLIVVDYLQLMQGPKYSQSREQEIAAISRSLKALAKELEVPVIALSQLNREVEKRTDKRPSLADLRESGAIEQDADVVLFVHRPELFGIDHYEDQLKSSTAGTAEVIVAKHRNGPTDTVRLSFIKEYTRFENLDPRHNLPVTTGEDFTF